MTYAIIGIACLLLPILVAVAVALHGVKNAISNMHLDELARSIQEWNAQEESGR